MKSLVLTGAIALAALWQSPAAAQAKVYKLDPAHSQASFMVDRFGFTTILGAFSKSEGMIWIDEARPENSRVEAKVMTDSLWTGDATRDGHVRSSSWLNAAASPAMTFKSTKVERTGAYTARVTGEMTIAGVTHPETFMVKLNKLGIDPTKKKSAGFSMTTEVSRKDFGILTAGPLIGDKVAIRIDTLAYEEPAG